MKQCPRCGEIKSASDFHKNAKMRDGLHCYCKSCWNAYCKERWIADSQNPERLRVRRAGHLRTKYGITLEQYESMAEAQGGVCALCGGPPGKGSLKVGRLGPVFSVDHDHACCPGQVTCGKCIRGLICERCNKAMGFVDMVGLEKVIGYLR
jgi:Recombination endonuclease VII